MPVTVNDAFPVLLIVSVRFVPVLTGHIAEREFPLDR
jgi:hypothetical protein